MANSNGWGDGAANNAIGWGQGANNNIGWGKSHSLSNAGATDIVGLTTDADAQAFITAAAITDATQQSAIDTLVKGLKTDGIWTKMKAIYPFVGGTASTHKWNLKDPRDLDAAFRLVFNGGWTHSSTGATPNGTNGYADTKLNPSSVLSLNSTHLSYYSRTNISALQVEMGLYEANKAVYLLYDFNGLGWKGINSVDTPSGTIFTPTNGMLIGNRPNSTTENYFHKGSLSQTISRNSVGLSAFKILLGSYNTALTNTPLYYSTKQVAFSTIGDGLTDTDASNLYTRVQTYQTALSRQV